MSNIELLRRIVWRCGPVPVVVVTAVDSATYRSAVYHGAIVTEPSLSTTLMVMRSTVPMALTAAPPYQAAAEHTEQAVYGDGPVTESIALLIVSHIRYHRRDPYWTAMQAILAEAFTNEDSQVN